MSYNFLFTKGKIYGIATLLLFLIFILQGCNKDNTTEPKVPENPNSQVRSAAEVVTEFAAVKQSATYNILRIFSGNYTKKLFEEDQLTYEQIDSVFGYFASLAEYQDKVESAVTELQSTSGLNKPGHIENITGLGDAMHGFFSWLTGSGKKSRNRILTVASNLSESERDHLYNSLRPGWKSKAKNSNDFWDKLQKGEFDNQASQMYNDFYYDPDSDFGSTATDKGLTIHKIVHKEGAEGVTKGSKLMIEVVKTATPLGKGMDMVEKAKEYKDRIQKLYTDPKNAIKDEVKSAIANKIGGLVDIDGAVDAGAISENAGSAIKFISDYTIGSDDPAEWIKKAADYGLGKILDSDKKGKKADIAIAVKKTDNGNGPSTVISVDPSDDDSDLEDVIDILLNEDDWIIESFDDEGNNDKVDIPIEGGAGTIVVISTDPEGEHTKGNYALSVWASPADPGPDQSVTVHAKINPPDSDIKIYFSIVGTDGYSKESTVPTDGSGLATFTIPGGDEGVHDVVTIKIVSSGLTRTISYTF